MTAAHAAELPLLAEEAVVTSEKPVELHCGYVIGVEKLIRCPSET